MKRPSFAEGVEHFSCCSSIAVKLVSQQDLPLFSPDSCVQFHLKDADTALLSACQSVSVLLSRTADFLCYFWHSVIALVLERLRQRGLGSDRLVKAKSCHPPFPTLWIPFFIYLFLRQMQIKCMGEAVEPGSSVSRRCNHFTHWHLWLWGTHTSGFWFLTFSLGCFHGGLSHGHPPCTSHMDEGNEVQRA